MDRPHRPMWYTGVESGMVTYVYAYSTQKAEGGGLHVPDQPGL